MLRHRSNLLKQIFIVVALLPMSWLLYWTSLYDNRMTKDGVRFYDALLSDDGYRLNYRIECEGRITFPSEPSSYFDRSLDLNSGCTTARRLQDSDIWPGRLKNSIGTRLIVESEIGNSFEDEGTTRYTFRHGDSSAIKSDSSLSIVANPATIEYQLLDSNVLIVHVPIALRAYDVAKDFALIDEIIHPSEIDPWQITVLNDGNRFQVSQRVGKQTIPIVITGLYGIEQNKIVELLQWQRLTYSYKFQPPVIGRNLYLIAPDLTSIEIRSIDNGQLIEQVPLHSTNLQQCFFGPVVGPYVTVSGGSSVPQLLDLRTGYFTLFPNEEVDFVGAIEETGHKLFKRKTDSGSELFIVNVDGFLSATHRLPFDAFIQIDRQNPNRLIASSSVFEMRAEVLSIGRDGSLETAKSFAPLVWLPQYQMCLLSLAIVWLVVFQITYFRIGQSFCSYLFWISVLLIGLAVFLCFRIQLSGEFSAVRRWEHQVLMGFYEALISCAALWLVFGPQRLSIRINVPILTWVFVLCWAYFVFGKVNAILASLAFAYIAIVIFNILGFALFRFLGLRIGYVNESRDVELVPAGAKNADAKYQLRDILLLIASLAAFFAVVRYFGAQDIRRIDSDKIISYMIAAIPFIANTLIALSKLPNWSKWPLVFITSTACICGHLLFWEHFFAHDVSTFLSYFMDVAFSLYASTFALTYVLTAARRTGLTWRRKRNPIDTKEGVAT
jgi:hypothetical protein